MVQFDCYIAMGTQADATTIRITQSVRLFIEEHARRTSPADCCGVLSGANGVITGTHPLRNGADNPETRYFATPEELFAAMRRIREAGQSLLGVYHSHPQHPAIASEHDLKQAMPFFSYIILSVMDGKTADIKSWKLNEENSAFIEEEIEITNY